MDLKMLWDNFDVIAEAENGIQRLRDLTLSLAVSGKLTAQNFQTSESANELLDRIQIQKQEAITSGLTPKPKKLGLSNEESIETFPIPESWIWTHLDKISLYIQRGKSPKYANAGKVKVISQKCIQWSGFDASKARFVKDESLSTYGNERYIQAGDLLWNSTGTGTVGRVNIFPDLQNSCKFVADSHVTVIRIIECLPKYVYYWLASPYVQNFIDQKTSGTTKQKELNTSTVRLESIPLPPLEEQKRIVKKVDDLMELCDRAQASKKNRNELQQQLRRSAIHALETAETEEDFKKSWRFVRDNFSAIVANSYDLQYFRQLILQLAIRGLLIPKNLNVRYQCITTNNSEKIPFLQIPKHWQKIPLGELGKVVGGGTPSRSSPSYWEGDIPWVSPKDMKFDYISDTQEKITHLGLENSSVKLIPKESLLMVIRGMILAHSFPVAIAQNNVTINQDMKALVLTEPKINNFLLLCLKALKMNFLSLVQRSSHGTCRLSGDQIFAQLIPIPPLEEQKRIVSKVDELMKCCDRVEESLSKKEELASAISASVIYHLKL